MLRVRMSACTCMHVCVIMYNIITYVCVCVLTIIVHIITTQWLVSELGEEFIIDETQDGATPIHIAAGKHSHL